MTRRPPPWRLWWRAVFLVTAIALSGLDLYAERSEYLALQARSPERLATAARLYPLDRNLRMAPAELAQVIEMKALLGGRLR